MKVFIFLILFILPSLGWGQDDLYGPETDKQSTKPAKTASVINYAPADSVQNWVYCQIVGTQRFLSPNKLTVQIDYGQRKRMFTDTRIRDEEGDVKDFNSMVDAMNYMGAQGWEFMQAYTITIGNTNVYHFLLRADMRNPIFIPQTKKK